MHEPTGADTVAQPDALSAKPRVDALAAMVARRIKDAMASRESSGIEAVWQEDADQYDGIDPLVGDGKTDAQQTRGNQQAGSRSKVVLNITKPKTDAAVARVQEMLVPNDDKPWELKPTPIPELVEAADSKSQQMLTLGDGSQATAEDVAKTVMAKATKATEAMTDWVEDQFVEGSVYAEMRKVIRSAGRLGTGVLKGPFPVLRESRKWTTTQGITALSVVAKTAPTSKSLDVRDLFPDPACGENIHNGSYVVERDYATARQLKKLAKSVNAEGQPEYDSEAIAAALIEGPPSRARDSARFRPQAGESVSESDVFELYYYYGDVDPDTLLEMGVPEGTIRPEDVALESVPAIVTMLNDRPIKAAVNPMETGEFPFDVFPWEVVEGQPWGRGVPRKMGVAQRMMTAATRAMLENAGLSAGPQVAITEGALTPMDGRYEITGRKLWKFKPNEFIAKIQDAMNVWNIDSAQEQLAAIIQFALQMADELTNLPLLLQGMDQPGKAPDTLGAQQMRQSNANAPLRVIAKQFDDYLIARHLRAYYDWGMQFAPENCRGDMQVNARGSTALVQREIAREFYAQAYPLSQRPGSRIDPDKLDAEIFRSNGVSFESVCFTDEEWAQRQEAMKNQPPPADPRIEAAQIRADFERERLEFMKQDHEADRQMQAKVKDIEFEIQALEFAGQKQISLETLKAMLAAKTIDSRDKRTEMQLKLMPAAQNPTRQGI